MATPGDHGPGPAAGAEPPIEIAQFFAVLRLLTPRVWVSPAILAVNVLVFLVMVASGVGLLSPTPQSVLPWGANFGPLTLDGERWRVVTNVFVHFGVVHLAFNMYALWNAGAVVERLYGSLRFAVVYVVAGLAGSVASLVVHPQVMSAGASGAVFGVFGGLAAFLIRQRGVMPMPVLKRLRSAAVSVIAFNMIFGLSVQGIDNAAHIGGLLGGAAAGALLARPLAPGRRHAPFVPLLVLAGAVGLTWLALVVLPPPA
jgi:rhomboid protease GluP